MEPPIGPVGDGGIRDYLMAACWVPRRCANSLELFRVMLNPGQACHDLCNTQMQGHLVRIQMLAFMPLDDGSGIYQMKSNRHDPHPAVIRD